MATAMFPGRHRIPFASFHSNAWLVIGLFVTMVAGGSADKRVPGSAASLEHVHALKFRNAAVATDSKYCSDIGRDILKQGGSAVDGAIAGLICCGVVQVHSTGIGGGGFMNVYNAATKEAVVFDYRETGPAALRPDSFDAYNDLAKDGGMAVGVPGEVRGLRKAWRRYGKLPWRQLIQPSIDLARRGSRIGRQMSRSMQTDSVATGINEDPGLRELLVSADGKLKKFGDLLKNPKYADTLEVIRDDPEDLYVGELAKKFVDDVTLNGGVMTTKDLKNYKVLVKKPIQFELGDLTVYTTPLPTGGPILVHILNMMRGYDFDKDDLEGIDNEILTYHRIAEIFKFSYGIRPWFGDMNHASDTMNITEALRKALSRKTAESDRRKIMDDSTQDTTSYSDYLLKHESEGTTHVAVIDEDGNAVSATSSIDHSFGAKFRSQDTGIVFNNEMADFFNNGSYPSKYETPSANRPGPGKRPLSCMCPSIGVDIKGDARLVIGGSGGSRITFSVAWVLAMHKIFKLELGRAVNLPRPQHSLFPEYIRNEKLMPMSRELIRGLKAKGHTVKNSAYSAVVQAISKDDEGVLHAKSDPRKEGLPSGY